MTKEQKIAALKLQYPTITKQINDEIVEIKGKDYQTLLSDWADVQLNREAKEAEVEAEALAKSALLVKLGINEDEAKLLLS